MALGLAALATLADAQWVRYPTPGLPRTADGKPDLNAPARRNTEGKPDLSGLWRVDIGYGYGGNIVANLADDEIMPWVDALYRQRVSDLGKDDPTTTACLPRGPRHILGQVGGLLVKVVQTPSLITMLYEDLAHRQIFMDGRPLPVDPNPNFMGYSVGRWEGDVLVVESIGFNDRTWLDYGGHPHTDALRMTERYRRVNLGRMDLQVTLRDPAAYRREWTVPVMVTLASDTELLEQVCNETGPAGRTNLTGRTSEQQQISIPAVTLEEYAGTYVADASVRLPFKTLRVRRIGTDLFLDIDGVGKLLILPTSPTTFTFRRFSLDFMRDTAGHVSQAVIVQAGAVFARQR